MYGSANQTLQANSDSIIRDTLKTELTLCKAGPGVPLPDGLQLGRRSSGEGPAARTGTAFLLHKIGKNLYKSQISVTVANYLN